MNDIQKTGEVDIPAYKAALVSDGGGPWVEMPRWVQRFIDFGYRWSMNSIRPRLCFVSTPCDSPAAGLIALGAMIRRMEQENADDLGSHYGRLVRESLRKPAELILQHRVRRGRYRVEIREGTEPWLCEVGKTDPQKFKLLEANATDWRPENEPPVEAFRGGAVLPNARLYREIMNSESQLKEQNLERSDSAIVLAGRATGKEATRRLFDEVLFGNETEAASLAELLTVHEWDRKTVSRIRYLSSRGTSDSRTSAVFDRPGAPPQLVIADGPAAFTAAQGNSECNQIPADMVTVIPRTSERDDLESFATELERLRQWYQVEQDPDAGTELPIPGVFVGTFVARV